MFYFLRLILVGSIILFSSISGVTAADYPSDPYKVPSIGRIILNNDSVVVVSSSETTGDPTLRRTVVLRKLYNNIGFELDNADSLLIRYFLTGYDTDWTDWKDIRFKEYTNLPAGVYTFQARYRDNNKTEGEIPGFTFRILPQWYLSNAAKAIYLILFMLIIRAMYVHLDLRFARRQYILEQIINKRTEDLIIEKEKTEALLANLLPKNTADEIMAKGKATKVKYNFVTVLFSDIQGFTKIAEEMNPEVLIDELDKFFFHFDTVVGKYGIEKIKTIGDAYMCAGGIPEKNRTNPIEVILAALEMEVYMKKLKETSEIEGMKYWDIRIGIHTGTVVAGVIGQKKMSYDIWGDTVNTASRMESSGEAGKINISGTTYEFVKEFFTCEYRGRMPVKYKGELEMYFVTGIIPGLCDEDGTPNSRFITKMQMIRLQDIEDMITKLFDDEAPPNLYFHNSSLVKNVSNQVELLSTAMKVPEEEYLILKLASVFLFTGYIYDYEKPMEASLRLVEEILPRYGFSTDTIESASKLIKNSFTDNIKSSHDDLLHDARYDYLGRVDFIKLTDKLLRERTEYGKHSDRKGWIETQKKLLTDHEFKTDFAKLLRSVPVEEQIKALEMTGE
jgi:class 3 adenylate cyclase